MNLQTTTHTVFQTGLAQPMPTIPGLPSFGEAGKKKTKQPAEDLQPGIEMVEDAGLGAMTGLGVAMMFNAGLALAGLVGWELYLMLR